jgi:hypothetical protein
MHPNNVREAAYVLGVSSERMFSLAEEWEETFIPRKKVCDDFQDWYFDGKVPQYLEDFVIDVLAGRVPPKQLTLKNRET